MDSFLTEDYRTISPPAEYAEDSPSMKLRDSSIRYTGYQRSYSHSNQTVASDDEAEYSPTTFNINSHKSLPDLHSQICRHSPHSEALSCCSRGNRSNKSGSSFNNRDSGGSSGHYTHRSEPGCKLQPHQHSQLDMALSSSIIPPPPMHDFRRDSGSSTQHSSGNSYYAYHGIPPPPVRYDCIECRAEIQNDANCLLNFTTLEVPEAFQDDYTTTVVGTASTSACNKTSTATTTATEKAQRYQDIESNIARQYYKRASSGGNESVIHDAELSPPLGTFRRQRGLRLKQRGRYSSPSDRNCRSEDDRRPILRSKSDIGSRTYQWQRSSSAGGAAKLTISPATLNASGGGGMDKSSSRKSISDSRLSSLDRFFEHLGLTDETYELFIAPSPSTKKSSSSYYSDSIGGSETAVGGGSSAHSSPVFFSDTSTVDSNRLPDSTETNAQNTQTFRPSEPPSIVERNARIIKWLCNCRKVGELPQ